MNYVYDWCVRPRAQEKKKNTKMSEWMKKMKISANETNEKMKIDANVLIEWQNELTLAELRI